MKYILIFGLLLANQAIACPDLSGSFTCTALNGQKTSVTISQILKNNVTIYTFDNNEVPADNVVYNLPDNDQVKNATRRVWCNSNGVVETEYFGETTDGAENFRMNEDYTAANSSFSYSIHEQIYTGNSPINQVSDSKTCTKN